jgi:undecaprenyl-diphosphatase
MNIIDYSISTTLVSFVGEWPLLDSIAVFFAQYAGYGLLIFLGVLFVWKHAYGAVVLQALIASFVSRGVLTEAIRFFLHRTRPFETLSFSPLVQKLTEVNSSFPSGHAAFYFAIATVVFLQSKKLGSIFLVVSLLIGIARVYGGVHWASDILAGAAIGIVSGLFVSWLFRKLQRK